MPETFKVTGAGTLTVDAVRRALAASKAEQRSRFSVTHYDDPIGYKIVIEAAPQGGYAATPWATVKEEPHD